MRTDCIIDNVRVRCPNTSTLGYAKWFCKRNDLFNYSAGGDVTRHARSLGRVRADGKTFILALVLAADGTFAYERWVDPASVHSINDPPTEFAKFFFAKRLPAPDIVRKLGEGGTLSQQHIGHVKRRIEAMKAGLNAYQSTNYAEDGSIKLED